MERINTPSGDEQQLAYNRQVKSAYLKILKQAKQMLSTVEQEELRFTLEREDRTRRVGVIVHEFVNPLIYIRLEWHNDNINYIHFGIEQLNEPGQLSTITTHFLRSLYKHTSHENTTVDIEDCVRTDWFNNSPSAFYEYAEERGLKYHTFKQLPYKPKLIKRKLKAVA